MMEEITRNPDKFIKCECGSHGYVIEYDSDGDQFYFSTFSHAGHTETLWTRIKMAWRYIRYGYSESDDVLIFPDKAKELANFIYGEINKYHN
jgi:hypothetical protein